MEFHHDRWGALMIFASANSVIVRLSSVIFCEKSRKFVSIAVLAVGFIGIILWCAIVYPNRRATIFAPPSVAAAINPIALPMLPVPPTPPEPSSLPSEKVPIATARLLYDAQTNELTTLDHDGVQTVIIASPSDMLLNNNNGPWIIKFGFVPHESGPFDVNIQTTLPKSSLGRMHYRILEDEARFVSILVSRDVIGLATSHEVNIKFYRK